MQLLDKEANVFLYQQVIDFVEQQYQQGLLKAGDKLPSLRKLSSQLGISVPTVKQAYIELERRGQVQARPQSGYYVKATSAKTLLPMRGKWSGATPTEVNCRSMIEQVYDAIHLPDTVALGISNPIKVQAPDKTLARLMRKVLSQVSEKAVSYGPINGDKKLRMQLAYRYQEQGVQVAHEDIVITCGAQEAISIALQCVAEKGDVIAIESPCYFGIIELIETLGMKAVEIYTCPEEGVCLDELAKSITHHNIKACVFSTAINNPLGSKMPDEKRAALVGLIESNQVPLIEDDVYGELYFSGKKPKPAQLFSKDGLVMTCSSFSKTAAPGYRVGYLIPGKFEEQAKRIKRAQSCSTAMLPQWTLSEYVSSGDYDRHLHTLRKKLMYNCERMRCAIAHYFPKSVCISQPQGGSVLWVRCSSKVNTGDFFQQAIDAGVSFAPGMIFSPSGKYHNYMRISFGVHWDNKVDQAIKVLGEIIHLHYQKHQLI